jgi:hypothetical protein
MNNRIHLSKDSALDLPRRMSFPFLLWWYLRCAFLRLFITTVLHSLTPVEKTIHRHPRVADLSEEEQKYYYDLEVFAKKLLKEREENRGILLPGSRQEAEKVFGVGARRVDQKLNEYIEYRDQYGAELAVDYFLVNKRGPKSGRRIGDLQQAAIRFALLKRARMIIVEGEKIVTNVEYSLKDVYAFMQAICQEVGEAIPSRDTVRRYIEDIKALHPTLYELGVWGREAVERKFVYKRANKVFRADARWQCDARDLPLYVLVNGKPCTVCLLIIYDDYTGYIVHWKLIPKVTWDAAGRPRKCNFTARDVSTLLATAMYITGRQPDEFYTDNGAQFEAIKHLIPFMVNRQGKTMLMVNSRPRKPWGRGKVERALGRVNELISRLPGRYDKSNRTTIDLARRRALPLEHIEKKFADHFQHVNTRTQGRGRKPNRHDQYWSVISGPRPAFIRMAQLDLESRLQWSSIDQWSFHCLGSQYEPKLHPTGNNSHIYRLWLDASTSAQQVRVCAIKLLVGWRVEVRLGMGDDEQWIEAVPKGSQNIETEDHAHDQMASLKGAEDEQRDLAVRSEHLIRERTGMTPELDPATGTYLFQPSSDSTLTPLAESESGTSAWLNSGEPAANVSSPAATDVTNGKPVQASTNDTGTLLPVPTRKTEKIGSRRRQQSTKQETDGGMSSQDTSLPSLDDLPDIDALMEAVRTKQRR